MAKYCIGDFIKETRERRGYTQEQLSFGICSTSSLSRIETGGQNPNYQTLDALLERLGTENGAFTQFVSKDEAEFYQLKRKIREAIIEQKDEELERLLQKMEKSIDSKIIFEKQYFLYAKGTLHLKKKKEYQKVMNYYMEAIHITLPDFNGVEPLKRNLLTFDEITIINAIASIHAKEGRLKTAIRIGNWLKEYMEEKVIDENERKRKYPMIIYNLTNWLGHYQRYLDVIEMADCGIEFCIQNGTLRYFPNMIFNKSCALAELGKKEEAKRFFTQAIAIFDSVGDNKKKEKAIAWCETRYQIEIDI